MSRRLQTLRGGACLLLVLYHVVGATSHSGLCLESGTLRLVSDWLAVIRMPMFAFLAGWVYAERPPLPAAIQPFIVTKVQRLLVPMVIVGTLFLLVQAVVPGVNGKVGPWPFVFPVAHFWFVESLFLILVALALLERTMLQTEVRFLVVFGGSLILYLWVPGTHMFSIDGALFLLPYVLLGVGLGRFGEVRRLEAPACVAVLLGAFAMLTLLTDGPSDQVRHTATYFAMATILILLALGSRFTDDRLIVLGAYSYTIYLFHVFFSAESRIVLHQAGISNLPVLVIAGVTSGVLGPILLHRIVARYPLPSALLLGKRSRATGGGVPVQPVHRALPGQAAPTALGDRRLG